MPEPTPEPEETVQVYEYGDSGPYGYWTEVGPDGYTGDGFDSENPTFDVPMRLFDALKEASSAKYQAEHALREWIKENISEAGR